MDITINEWDYHIGNLTGAEQKYIRRIHNAVYDAYPRVKGEEKKVFLRYGNGLSAVGQEVLAERLIRAILKSFKDADTVYGDETSLCRDVKNAYLKSLPYVLKNEKYLHTERDFLFEPINAYTFFLLTEMQNAVTRYFSENSTDEDENVKRTVLLLNNTARSLRSSLMLFAAGDDVHGYGMYRGIIEQLSRIVILCREPDPERSEFFTFTEVNRLLQIKKMKIALSEDDAANLRDFLSEHNLTEKSAENFLLYGWIKTKNGRRVGTATDMIKEAFGAEGKHYCDVFHFASEFLHEDYIGVEYDYPGMRKMAKVLIPEFTYRVFVIEKAAGVAFSNEADEAVVRIGEIIELPEGDEI